MASVTINGKTFEATPRYAEGHSLTANEAAALNQVMFENVGNNLRKTIKEGKTPDAELQKLFNSYVKDYQFGVRSARAAGDPVAAEAHKMAVAYVKDQIRGAGKKVADYTTAQINEAASQVVESDPAYTEAAKKTVAQRNALKPTKAADLSALIGKA